MFSGKLRYQNFQASRNAIPGPCDVWLDAAQHNAPLNQMRIATRTLFCLEGERPVLSVVWAYNSIRPYSAYDMGF